MSGLSPASVSEDGDHRSPPKPPQEHNRACKVCGQSGDKPNGYNFGVLTCESCKAFFRRNASKENEIKCPFSNSCKITPASRKYCQACRLKKCFAAGMSREWLVEQKNKTGVSKKRPKKEAETDSNSEEEISVPKAYLKELMRKAKGRPASCECTCTCGFYPRGTKLEAPISQLLRPTVSAQLPLMGLSTVSHPVFCESRAQRPLSSDASSLFSAVPSPFPLAASGLGSSGASAFSPLTQSVSSHDKHPFRGPLSCETPSSTTDEYARLFQMTRSTLLLMLTPEETEILQELIRVAQPLNSPLDIPLADCSQMSILDVVKITEHALKRMVCMARDLSAFKNLPIEDRKTLMKACSSELLILRGVMAFDVHKNMWLHSLAQGFGSMEVKLEVLQSVAEHPQHYEEHKRFLESIDDRVRKKEAVILVLMAVLIFQPDCPGLRCREAVLRTQNNYLNLLRRLLAVEFGEVEAPAMFARLQMNLSELRQLNQSMVKVYYGFDQQQLDPLLKELFDM